MTVRDVVLYGRPYRWYGDRNLSLRPMPPEDDWPTATAMPLAPSPCVQWNFDQQAKALAARNIHAIPPPLGMVTH